MKCDRTVTPRLGGVLSGQGGWTETAPLVLVDLDEMVARIQAEVDRITTAQTRSYSHVAVSGVGIVAGGRRPRRPP